MLTLKVNKKDIEITEREDFVRGTVGAECRVMFDYSAWYQDFHTVTVVFKRYDGKPINILAREMEQVITIPHEILATSGSFRIGVFGVAENIVTPTLWSDEIKVEYGTETNGTAPEEYTPTEIEQIKTELDKNKVEIDKKLDKNLKYESNLSGFFDAISLYGSTIYGYRLLAARQSDIEGTIPVRDTNGSIACKIAIKDGSGKNYTGAAAPHTWVNDRINTLNKEFVTLVGNLPYANQISQLKEDLSRESETRNTEDKRQLNLINLQSEEINALTQTVNDKGIIVHQIGANNTLELKTNSLYAFLKNGDSNKCSIGLADDIYGTNFEVLNAGTEDEITMKFGIVIIPKNTMGTSKEYPPAYYGVAAIDKTVVVTTTVSSKKFTILKSALEQGKHIIAKTDNNGTFMVWELKL